MSPEAQRIAIAEQIGWKLATVSIGENAWAWSWISPTGETVGSKWMTEAQCRSHNNQNLPDYLNDLNAMHEAEIKCLNWNEQESEDLFNYRCNLATACGHDKDLAYFASASARAEALLKAIGKWGDTK